MNSKSPGTARGTKWCCVGLCVLVICLSAVAARPAGAKAEAPFTVVLLPDTQHYSRKYPELFMAQTEWIKANLDKESIVFVTHVGDVVNDHKKDTNQWLVAQKAMSVLDGAVPWGVAIGNHDFDSSACRPDKATTFLQYFSPERFRRQP